MDATFNISKFNGSAYVVMQGNASFIMTLEEYLLHELGLRTSPHFLLVAVIYLFIFVVGVGGNLLTCTVIARHRKMHTPTNLYLFSLAISDLLVLLMGMPLETYELWRSYPFVFGEFGCLFKVFLLETVCFASVLNVTALSVERYMAVVHPLRTRHTVTRRHALRVIAAVWLLAVLCALPITFRQGVTYLEVEGAIVADSAICTTLKPLWIYNLVIQVTTITFYFVPMTIISVLYILIGIRLGREQRALSGGGGTGEKGDNADINWSIQIEEGKRRQVTKMLAVVVLVFAICWAPFHGHRLLWSFTENGSVYMYEIYGYVHLVSGVFFYLSSAVNPIIYNLLSSRFRERFRELVCQRHRHGACRAGAGVMASRNGSPPFGKAGKSSSCSTYMSSSGRSQKPRDSASNSGWEHEEETFM